MSHHLWRLLPYAVADGPHNMAMDEVLLEAAIAGIATLRFYGWSQATASLGYFQPADVLQTDQRLATLPFVRRPSGGATLVHDFEVTYCLGLPAGSPWQPRDSWLRRMHGIIAAALNALAIPARLPAACDVTPPPQVLCFRHITACDVLVGQAKVVGSAQRRQRGALMQHGGILLARSAHAPELPGIEELTGQRLAVADLCTAILSAFCRQTGWAQLSEDLIGAEQGQVEELAKNKYATDQWNRKR